MLADKIEVQKERQELHNDCVLLPSHRVDLFGICTLVRTYARSVDQSGSKIKLDYTQAYQHPVLREHRLEHYFGLARSRCAQI